MLRVLAGGRAVPLGAMALDLLGSLEDLATAPILAASVALTVLAPTALTAAAGPVVLTVLAPPVLAALARLAPN
jgi:hypothetical protein